MKFDKRTKIIIVVVGIILIPLIVTGFAEIVGSILDGLTNDLTAMFTYPYRSKELKRLIKLCLYLITVSLLLRILL